MCWTKAMHLHVIFKGVSGVPSAASSWYSVSGEIWTQESTFRSQIERKKKKVAPAKRKHTSYKNPLFPNLSIMNQWFACVNCQICWWGHSIQFYWESLDLHLNFAAPHELNLFSSPSLCSVPSCDRFDVKVTEQQQQVKAAVYTFSQSLSGLHAL